MPGDVPVPARRTGCQGLHFRTEGEADVVLLEFSMYPTDQGESVSDFVKRSLEIIDDSGLDYRLGPMGTTVEGEIDQVLDVVRQCFERMSTDCNRIACVMKMDWRRGKSGRLNAKVDSLKQKTGRDLRT
jgi:uncharacterized protein (TIGR00106 family)